MSLSLEYSSNSVTTEMFHAQNDIIKLIDLKNIKQFAKT